MELSQYRVLGQEEDGSDERFHECTHDDIVWSRSV